MPHDDCYLVVPWGFAISYHPLSQGSQSSHGVGCFTFPAIGHNASMISAPAL